MYTIKTLNKISPLGLNRLDAALFTVDDNAATPEGILVRSADMLQMDLPQSHWPRRRRHQQHPL